MTEIIEIERKFLVKPQLVPELSQYPSENIWQGYLGLAPVVRIRKKGEKCVQTVKSIGLLVRKEVEFEIAEKHFNDLKDMVICDITKVRYKIPYGKYTIELDVFPEGYIIVEVEFPSIEEAEAFVVPEWFGAEVTYIKEFSNAYLAQRGYPKNLKCPECNGKGYVRYSFGYGNETSEPCEWCKGDKVIKLDKLDLGVYNQLIKEGTLK